jgi:two-component system, LytTR family, sensor kinase
LDATSLRLDDTDRARTAARRRSALILIAAFWAFAVLMLSVRALLIDSLPLSILGPRRLITAAIGALLCFGMAGLLAALRSRSFPERAVWGLAGAFVMALTLTSVTMTLNRIIIPLPGLSFSLVESAQWVLVWLGYFLAWTGTHLALTYHWESQDHQRQAALLAEMTREAQRTALRYQLNPHFLFNTLNSVASLVGEQRNPEAEAMLLNLATFVRSTLTDAPSGAIPLRQEIDLQRLYLDIEQVRFGDRLKVEIELPDALAAAPVPALILQPLIENAIIHGVGRSEDALTVRIVAEARGGLLELSVEDDGAADPAVSRAGGGLGLSNVAARLHAHYGEAGSLDAAPRPEGGFRARLAFPLAAG